jgi:protein-tyrosine sulfotransferase
MGQFDAAAVYGLENGHAGGLGEDPAFVLCLGRSGSTLLRLILDSHPDLACPPETNIPALCSQLAVVWSLIEGAPLSLQRGDAPPMIPDAAIAGIRKMMDLMTTPYLKRRRKKRYCDKSLGTAAYAKLLLRIYPDARFVCLFRHPMDMISSGLEACPWGLNGYGFDRYIADSPGNAVMALARYWLDGATAIAAFEENNPESCHRVRYEDLVTDPERIAAGIFDFLGVGQMPRIEEAVFSGEHERFGPADHKIWYTEAISQGSVGRADSLPVGLIPPPVLESMNMLLDKLGYVQVDQSWGTADMPGSLLVPKDGDTEWEQEQPLRLPGADVLADRLVAGLARFDASMAARWDSQRMESFTVVIRQPRSAPWVQHVDLASGRVLSDSEYRADDAGASGSPDEDDVGVDWSVVGTSETWRRLLDGDLNMSTALRSNELRYCDYGENDYFVTEARISLLAALLKVPATADTVALAGGDVAALADR